MACPVNFLWLFKKFCIICNIKLLLYTNKTLGELACVLKQGS